MNVIAERKQGLWIFYLLLSLFGVLILILGTGIVNFLASSLLIIAGVFTLIQYMLTPKEILSVDNNECLHLHSGTVIKAKDIIDVSYRRASHSMYIHYKWGDIILKTVHEEYEFRYVANCEDVAKEIMHIQYKNKYQDEDLSSEDILK